MIFTKHDQMNLRRWVTVFGTDSIWGRFNTRVMLLLILIFSPVIIIYQLIVGLLQVLPEFSKDLSEELCVLFRGVFGKWEK